MKNSIDTYRVRLLQVSIRAGSDVQEPICTPMHAADWCQVCVKAGGFVHLYEPVHLILATPAIWIPTALNMVPEV